MMLMEQGHKEVLDALAKKRMEIYALLAANENHWIVVDYEIGMMPIRRDPDRKVGYYGKDIFVMYSNSEANRIAVQLEVKLRAAGTKMINLRPLRIRDWACQQLLEIGQEESRWIFKAMNKSTEKASA